MNLVTGLQNTSLAILAHRPGASVSDLEVTPDLETLELDLDQLERDLILLHDSRQVLEVGMSDLQENDYSAYCAVYEGIYGHAPLLRRQAD